MNKIYKFALLLGVPFAALCALCADPYSAFAATANAEPATKISFTFDDGFSGAYTKAAPALATYGYSGTSYVAPVWVGKDSYMTWPQIGELRNRYRWEIGSHTLTHPLLTQVSATKLESELLASKAVLESHGFVPTSFASPYGDYNPKVLAGVARHYQTHRVFRDEQNYNVWPYNDYLLYVKRVQVGVSVDQVKRYVDEAAQQKAWLVLVFHEIADNPSPDPARYEYSTEDLKQIAAYVQSKNIPVVNVSAGLVTSDTNLLPNATFDSGIAKGWTTDAPTLIKKSTATKGSYPSPKNSIELNAATDKSVHLFSPKVNVDPTATYVLKAFLNVEKITGGELAFYIDEYDANGNWISGQYKRDEKSAFVENINLSYKPTSANVKKASLQIPVAANSGIKAFVDSVQWFKS